MDIKYFLIKVTKANALNIPPGEYDRKIETQGNWRELLTSGGACILIWQYAYNLTNF